MSSLLVSEDDFTSACKNLRESLLADSTDLQEAKMKIKIALRSLDEDGNGCVTSEELRDYILSHGVSAKPV